MNNLKHKMYVTCQKIKYQIAKKKKREIILTRNFSFAILAYQIFSKSRGLIIHAQLCIRTTDFVFIETISHQCILFLHFGRVNTVKKDLIANFGFSN